MPMAPRPIPLCHRAIKAQINLGLHPSLDETRGSGQVKWSGKMDLIESSLRRLHDRVSRFIDPSAALRDVRCLKAQIELWGQVLRDIQVMRCGLRPL